MASSLKVLILEDDPAIGEIQVAMLGALGYVAVLARHGGAALDACRAHRDQGEPFQLALLDLTIEGGLGGREIVPKLKELDAALRLIACSGFCEETLNAQLLREGFADVLAKPFRPQELAAVLEKNRP
ncbi:MAG: response regulator [Verrucomicrobium sp.]|nr:response regulator [Verrucomicrobium sp.]